MRRVNDVDALAAGLARWGRVAKTLAPGEWENAGSLYPVVSVTGQRIGRLMPGYGIVLDGDLKRFGVTRPIEGVISRSVFARAIEKLLKNDGAITSMAAVRAAYANTRQAVPFTFVNAGNAPAGFCQCWGSTFTNAPGSAPDRTNAAAFNGAMLDPPAGQTKYIVGVLNGLTGTIGSPFGHGMAIVVDVLVECGNINFAVNTVTTLNTTALTRYTTGVGVYVALFAQDATSYGGPSATITVVYTNQAGNPGTGTITSDGDTAPHFLEDILGDGYSINLNLAAGDYGVRAITSIQTSLASIVGGGNDHAALHLYKPLVFVQAMQETGGQVERDCCADPTLLTPLATTAGGVLGCLQAYYLSVGAAVNFNMGFSFDTIYG